MTSSALSLAGVLLAANLSLAADAPVALAPVESWSDLFGDQAVTLSFRVRAAAPWKGRVRWRYSVGGHTITRGEDPAAAGPGRPATVAVHLPVPPVKDGVALETRLAVSAAADGPGGAAALDKVLWVFPRDPFAGRTRWLKDRKITLFDPPGTTARVLRGLAVPFAETRNVDALDRLGDGLLLVGEGVSFKEEPGLPAVLLRAAGRGLPVLCLAPAEGAFPVPGSEGAAPAMPAGLSFRRQDVIGRLDKRLDVAWPPDGKVVASRIALRGEGAGVVAEVGDGPGGWPWLDVTYPGGKGRLLLCGFGLVAHWEAGPAPRFLFARLLELLAGEPGAGRAGPAEP